MTSPDTAGWAAPALSPAARVDRAWRERTGTDYVFENPWLNILLLFLTCGIFGFYLFYQLMRRDRDHNRRRLELLDAATTFAWNDANAKGLAEELRPAFERIAAHLEVLRTLTREFRDPALWLLIYFFGSTIGLVIAFVLLDGDLIKHDRAEGAVEAELAAIYGRLGQPLPVPDPSRVKNPDNYAGRIVATIFTCGIYALWWWVDQMRDGNRHYEINWAWEDHLAQAVRNLEAAA
jgi:hypothetical protein